MTETGPRFPGPGQSLWGWEIPELPGLVLCGAPEMGVVCYCLSALTFYKIYLWLCMVEHTCNPSYSGGGGGRITVQGQPWGNVGNPTSAITKAKRGEGVDQVTGGMATSSGREAV
jgi:hypothetical protein